MVKDDINSTEYKQYSKITIRYIQRYVYYDISGNTTNMYRTVVVCDLDPPVITIKYFNPHTIEASLTDWGDYGVIITDNYYDESEVTITKNIDVNVSVPHTLYHILQETPLDNVSSTLYRTVIIEDNTKPIITILGDNPQLLMHHMMDMLMA